MNANSALIENIVIQLSVNNEIRDYFQNLSPVYTKSGVLRSAIMLLTQRPGIAKLLQLHDPDAITATARQNANLMRVTITPEQAAVFRSVALDSLHQALLAGHQRNMTNNRGLSLLICQLMTTIIQSPDLEQYVLKQSLEYHVRNLTRGATKSSTTRRNVKRERMDKLSH